MSQHHSPSSYQVESFDVCGAPPKLAPSRAREGGVGSKAKIGARRIAGQCSADFEEANCKVTMVLLV